MSKRTWREWGYHTELRLRKLRVYLSLVWMKLVMLRYAVEIRLLELVHYGTGGKPVVVEPEIDEDDSDE